MWFLTETQRNKLELPVDIKVYSFTKHREMDEHYTIGIILLLGQVEKTV
jgi:RNAse (barnase) inhibitor barstar